MDSYDFPCLLDESMSVRVGSQARILSIQFTMQCNFLYDCNDTDPNRSIQRVCWPILLWLHRIAPAEHFLWQPKFYKQLQDIFNASRVIVAELKQWEFSITNNTLLSNLLLQWTNKTLQWCSYLKPCSVQIQQCY